MLNKPISILVCILLIFCVNLHAIPWRNDDREDDPTVGLPLVRKDERVKLVSTEYGEVSAVRIGEGKWGPYYNLQFITLEPNALFLPVALHADMVFFVHSGSGKLSWANGDKIRRVELKRGDVYRLPPGAIFFVQSNLDNDQQKLRIHAIFTNPIDNLHEVAMEAYSSIPDLVLGFGKKVLQSAFQVSEEMIEELMSGRQEAIVQAPTTQKKEKSLWETDSLFMEVLLGRSSSIFDVNKKKKTKAFNIFERKPDFKNRYGESLIVNKKDMSSLKKPDLSIFMVNLTGGSMMGPHWNPMSSEVSIVLQGEGMIHIVGPSTKKASDSTLNTTFQVGEGDVFVVPRFQPMAQMAFSNHSFVFMGFSTTTKKNHPQYLAGKASVLRTLHKDIMAASFAVTNMSKFDWLLDQQGESVILECASCAEEELTIVEEEIRRKKEEARRREEEERKREEEEKRRREEEARRREEEERKREEEERKREEEEKKRREEEEEKKKREEEAEARKREEEARRKQEEEARREEEEAKRQEKERRQREEEEARKEEEEEKKRREEEEEARKREEARRKREEEARREEEEAKRQEEERRRREEEETRKEEEKEAKRQEEERRRQEEEETRKEEEKEVKRQEDERKRQEEEEKQKRQEKEEARRKEEEEQAKRQEEEEAKRQKEEEVRREEEEAKRQEEERRQREEEEARRQEEESRKKEEAEEEERKGQEEKEKQGRQEKGGGEKQGRQEKGGGEGRKGEEEYVKMRETEARKKEEAAKREEEEARKQEEEVKRKEEEIVQEEEWSKGKKSE